MWQQRGASTGLGYPLTFGWFLKGPVQLQVCESERTGSGVGQQARSGRPERLPQLLPACLLSTVGAKGLSQGLKNVPREGRN